MKAVLFSILILVLVCACTSGTRVEKKKLTQKDDMGISKVHAYGEIVSLQEKDIMRFPDFDLTYIREENPEDGSEITSTMDIRIRHFLLTDKNGTREIEISHGQFPPPDHEIKSGDFAFMIYSYQTPSGINLFPGRLMIQKVNNKN